MHCSARTLSCAFLWLLSCLFPTAPDAAAAGPAGQPDWLIDPAPYRARIAIAPDSSQIATRSAMISTALDSRAA